MDVWLEGSDLGFFWGILSEFIGNSLGLCGWGILNVWVLILEDKEVRFDLMTGYKNDH